MYDTDSRNVPWLGGFFMLIGFTIAGAVLSLLIYTPIWESMTGKSIRVFNEGLFGPEDSDAMKVVQTISAIFSFLVPAIIVARILQRKPLQLLGFTGNIKLSQAGIVMLIIVAALFISTSLAYFNNMIPIPASWKDFFDKLEAAYNRQVEVIIRLNSPGDFIISLVVMGFLPAICEEALFRGGLQNFLTRSTRIPWLSIIIVSLLFSFAHLSFYGFLSRFFLGIVLGLIFQYSGKLWLCIIAHFLNNAIALTMLYVYKLQGKPIRELIDQTSSNWIGIFVVPLLAGLFYLFYKRSAVKEPEPVIITEQNEKPMHGI